MMQDVDRRARIMRRFMHIGMSTCLIYYLTPYYVWGIHRAVWMLIILLSIPITVDAIRLKRGLDVYGLRDHERHRVASYVWFFIGSAFLMAFFPQEVAAPVILAVAVGDVVLGETRRFRRRVAYGFTYLTCTGFFFLFGYPFGNWAAPTLDPLRILLTLFAGLITTIAESVELEIRWGLRDDFFVSRTKGTTWDYRRYFDVLFKFDDDFLMQILPAIILGVIWLINQQIFPVPMIHPLPDPWNVLGEQKWFWELVV